MNSTFLICIYVSIQRSAIVSHTANRFVYSTRPELSRSGFWSFLLRKRRLSAIFSIPGVDSSTGGTCGTKGNEYLIFSRDNFMGCTFRCSVRPYPVHLRHCEKFYYRGINRCFCCSGKSNCGAILQLFCRKYLQVRVKRFLNTNDNKINLVQAVWILFCSGFTKMFGI